MAPPARIMVLLPLVFLFAPPALGQGVVENQSPESIAGSILGEFDLVANEQCLWIYRQVIEESSGDAVVFFAFRDLLRKDARFFQKAIGPMTGKVYAMALRGMTLHMFFEDGSHHALVPITGRFSGLGTPNLVRERNLPDAALPRQLFSGGGKLLAVISQRQAKIIVDEAEARLREAREEAARRSDGESADAAADGELPAAPLLPPTEMVIVRLEEGQWRIDRPAPPECKLEGTVERAWSDGQVIQLMYKPQRDAEPQLWISEAADSPWQPGGKVPEDILAGTLVDGRLVSVTTDRANGRPVIAPVGTGAGAESQEARPLALDEAGFLASEAPSSWAIDSQTVTAVRDVPETGFSMARWNAEDGALAEAPALIKPLIPRDYSGVPPATRHVLEYSVLGLSLLIVLFWKRERLATVPTLGANQASARLSQRFLAVLIDLMIMAPAWLLMVYKYADLEGSLGGESLSVRPDEVSPRYWARAVFGLVYGFYAFVFEAIIGATPGKRLLGLLVVRDDGERIGIGAALVRNIVRPVEFHFFPLLFLAVVTRGRQRMGDLLGACYVVEITENVPDSAENKENES
jgi:uncharacterized RDD family membrane protein YckC